MKFFDFYIDWWCTILLYLGLFFILIFPFVLLAVTFYFLLFVHDLQISTAVSLLFSIFCVITFYLYLYWKLNIEKWSE